MATATGSSGVTPIEGIIQGFEAERTALGGDLSPEQNERIQAQFDALRYVYGSPTDPRTLKTAFEAFRAIGSSEITTARKAQDERLREEKIQRAVDDVDLASATATESSKLGTLSKEDQTLARTRLAQKLFRDFANNATKDVPTLMAELDTYKSTGKISEETAEAVKKALNDRVADLAKSIQSDLDTGILTPAGVEARLATIGNPDLRKLVGAKFGEIVNSSKYSTEADSFLTPASGGTPTTTAALDAALASRPPAEAIGIRKALNEKVMKKANDYRELVTAGHRTMQQVEAEINGMPDSVQKDLLLKNFAAEFAGTAHQARVDAIPNISGQAQAIAALNGILNSPEFNNLPPAQARAIREAASHQIDRLAGTDTLYQRREERLESEHNLRTLEINRKNWEIMRARIRRLVLPTAAVLGIGMLSGLGVGFASNNIAAGIISGLGGSLVAGGVGIGINSILENNLHYVSKSRLDMQKLENERRTLIEKDQEIYTNIHTVRAERASMPIQALGEISKLAAEAAWIRLGRNSGVPRDQWINSFLQQTTFSDLDELRHSISGMTLVPSSIPLT